MINKEEVSQEVILMYIVFATHSYWPHLDGVQMVNQYMAEGLVNAGHRVTILTSRLENYSQYEKHNGVEIYRFVHRSILKFNFGESKKFKKFLLKNREEIDVLIVVAAQSFAGEWALQVSNQLFCKKIMYMHGMKMEHVDIHKTKNLCHFMKEYILSLWSCCYFKCYWNKVLSFDAAIHLFERDSSFIYFRNHGFENNIVIKNGCDSILFKTVRNIEKKHTIKKIYHIKKRYFLCVANYNKNKNQKAALKAYYETNIENIDLIFVGSDRNEYFEELEKMNQKLEEKDKFRHSVKILYGISREDTISIIKDAYAIVLSSDSEYLPITILEGLAAGKPYISTNVGVVPLLPGGVIAHDNKELVYWMEYYAGHSEYVDKLGKIGREYAERELCIDDKVEQLKEVIFNL